MCTKTHVIFGKAARQMKEIKIFASCHNHSTFSDAEYSPEQLVDIAHSLGHGGIIITDHSGILGGLTHLGEEYACPDNRSVIPEEGFMTLYERRLG